MKEKDWTPGSLFDAVHIGAVDLDEVRLERELSGDGFGIVPFHGPGPL